MSLVRFLEKHSCWPTVAQNVVISIKGSRPNGKGGLSGGSILLIIFFSVMFVYILTGTLFMKFKRNAIGSEMFPNKSFWTNCPGLVKDGVRCLISPCSKRGEYQN